MTGKPGAHERCYFCGGELQSSLATIPFVVDESIVVIKHVPARTCLQCGETVLDSDIAEMVDRVLKQSNMAGFEVSIVSFEQSVRVPEYA